MEKNIQNVISHIRSKIIETWLSVVKPISRQTLFNLKLLKTNLVHISLNVLIAEMIIKQTATTVLSGNTGSTTIDIMKSSRNSKKLESIQFTQVWVGPNNNFTQSQDFFAKHLQEPSSSRYHLRK